MIRLVKKKRNSTYIVLLRDVWFDNCMRKRFTTKIILKLLLVIMAAMILGAIFFKEDFVALMQPLIQKHVRMMHIVAATIFFAKAMVGIIWERRSLATG